MANYKKLLTADTFADLWIKFNDNIDTFNLEPVWIKESSNGVVTLPKEGTYLFKVIVATEHPLVVQKITYTDIINISLNVGSDPSTSSNEMIGKQIVMYKGMIDGGGSGDDINARACYQIRIKPYEYGEFKATIFEKDLSSRLPIEFKDCYPEDVSTTSVIWYREVKL